MKKKFKAHTLEQITELRKYAESKHDDQELLELRRLERAFKETDPGPSGVHKEEFLFHDDISTTWRGRDSQSGAQIIMRLLKEEWANDIIMHRRLKRIRRIQANSSALWIPNLNVNQTQIPYLSVSLDNCTDANEHLCEWDTLSWTLALMRVLVGLKELHDQKCSFGDHFDTLMFVQNNQLRLLYLDGYNTPFMPQRDYQNLALWLQKHRYYETDSLPDIISEWDRFPPHNAEQTITLAFRELRELLLRNLEGMKQQSKKNEKNEKRILLQNLGAKLFQPPPHLLLEHPLGTIVSNSDNVHFSGDLVYSCAEGLRRGAAKRLREFCLQHKTESVLHFLKWLQLTIQLDRLHRLLSFQIDN
ncbi:MAG: hypothetical protein VX278_10025 [Myxococcota bacterium]|nr:hypothetical protein [Myxococcota bacterium]